MPKLTFAGVRLPLICVHNREAMLVRGDKQSVGYKKLRTEFQFQKPYDGGSGGNAFLSVN